MAIRVQKSVLGFRAGKKGFTLIELLVVISIIALLMAVLMPALARARKQAKSAACMVHIKQLALVLQMYVNDHDGYFNRGGWGKMTKDDHKTDLWFLCMQSYYSDAKLLFCPEAKNDGPWAGDFGGPFEAYGPIGWTWELKLTGEFCSGSYGINGYICNRPRSSQGGSEDAYMWRTMNVKSAAEIPMLIDNGWYASHPVDYAFPPEYDGQPNSNSGWGSMNYACINRHSGHINGAFLDFSVRQILLKELWTLKWHRRFDTANDWTVAGGVTMQDWAEHDNGWMKTLAEFR